MTARQDLLGAVAGLHALALGGLPYELLNDAGPLLAATDAKAIRKLLRRAERDAVERALRVIEGESKRGMRPFPKGWRPTL